MVERGFIFISHDLWAHGKNIAFSLAGGLLTIEELFASLGLEVSGYLAPDMITVSGRREDIERLIKEFNK